MAMQFMFYKNIVFNILYILHIIHAHAQLIDKEDLIISKEENNRKSKRWVEVQEVKRWRVKKINK